MDRSTAVESTDVGIAREREPTEAAAVDPRSHVETIASRKIKGFLGTIDESGKYYDPVHKQNQSLSQHIIADYHGRFLIELIQNAHDAHDRERRDGEIAVRLASDEGDCGTLYVANRGQPFGPDNVDALCEMGLSSKPPGEAVGNKGLGFRSVRHVTDEPQVFSRLVEDAPGETFDGYCFTFARGAELDPLLPTEITRSLARSDLPAFYIPLWIEQVPDAIAEFARRGFSTVIRLPIRNPAALGAVRDEMLALAKADAPMLLFLRRIGLLEAEIDGERLSEDAIALTLKREETPLAERSGPSLVDLGESGRFWMARAEIPEQEMQAAVAEDLESGALPESWRGWKGAGEVAVAVPTGDDSAGFNPRLYTFLPMGRGATSPFKGHLHGSFFPSSNRKSLDPTVKVNALVLTHAVTLSADAAHWLERRGSGETAASVPAATAARAAVDLLVWKTPSSLLQGGEDDDRDEGAVDLGASMATAIARRWLASTFADAEFVPCLGDWSDDPLARPEFGPIRWSSPGSARRPSASAKSFSLDVIARHGRPVGVEAMWPGLGQRRADSLAEFLRAHADGRFADRLSSVERAAIVEGLARSLAKAKQPDWARWRNFYRDLSAFMEADGDALAGREILICQDGSLRSARSNPSVEQGAGGPPKRRRRRSPHETSVFVPPRRGDAEESIGDELYPPAPVREFFAFLHDALPWYGDLADARQFLEKRLAQPFESEALLTRISQIVERDQTKKVRIAGLRWAFAIWRRSVAVKRPVTLSPSYRLYLPTLDGVFISASDAIFSSSWPDRTLGHKLQQFLELAPTGSRDIEEVRARRLASPSNSVFGTRHFEEWTEFLSGIGVQRGLQPRSVRLEIYVPAWRITSFQFLKDLGFPDAVGLLLKEHVGSHPGLPTSTNYEVANPIWWLPGQSEIGEFTDDALEAYATLVVEWIGRVEQKHLWMEVRHQHNYRSDTRNWPTPLAAFLRSAAWVPCEEPRLDGFRRQRCKAADVWLSSGSDRYPPFLRRPSFRLTRAIDRAPEAVVDQLRRHAGFKTFHASDTLLDQVGFLAEQFADGCVRRFYERELVNIYNRCWVRLAERHNPNQLQMPAAKPPALLLVRRRGELGFAKAVGSNAETVYVRDSPDSIAAGLVEVIGDPLLDVRTTEPAKIGRLLQQLYGTQVRRTSELAYAIHIGGTPLGELPLGPRLVDACLWLRPMLAVALEALDSVDLNRLPADRSSILQSLDRIELQMKERVSFVLEGRDVTPPAARPAYAFQRTEGEPLIIIVGEGGLNWSRVEAALPAIGDAIQHSAVVPHIKLLIRQLSLEGVPIEDRPIGNDDLLRLGRVLDVGDEAIAAAREALGERIDRQIPWLRAVVHLYGGEQALEKWLGGELAAMEDRTALIDLLRDCLSEGAVSPEGLVESVKQSFSTEELRERLALDFGKFNSSLVATGSAPDVNPEGQASQLAYFVDDRRIAIGVALRNMVAPAVLSFEPDERYKAAREELSDLRPDQDWLLRFQRVPDAQLEEYVETWLFAKGAPPMGSNPNGLEEIAAVRVANTKAVRHVGQAAQPLVRAWGIQHAVAVHDLWRNLETVEQDLRRRLDDAGSFDCRAWSEGELLKWFSRMGLWPTAMELTLDRARLGVPETEVQAEAQKAREDRERLDREARSVRLNGDLRDPREVDWLKLSEEIAAGLSKGVLNRPIGSLAKLSLSGEARKRRRGSGGGSGGGDGSRIPQEKKDMIGRLGELTVYHWLRSRQPDHDIDRCWVSTNAAQFNGQQGDDGLGYDFCISFNKQTWYIEVKASTGDPCEFELGETEVRKARDVARSRSAERYVIAYVANVGQTGATTVDVLPNPLAPDADGVLSIVGDSIRYAFSRLQ
ncbi:sacsin N-terminal ATP-binding-like domain-containing protein [Mesorhizobium abyssinicae]|uniref:sacsin N-terminal ATP-binding-like domain-containing protein n=1 Tax=Mesorhizobium abyssinicae TaxID=1209958 RepID=UPI003394AF68